MSETGTCVWFNSKKGFGFIRLDSDLTEVFVHYTNTQDVIKEGDTIIFEVEENEKGRFATKVRRKK